MILHAYQDNTRVEYHVILCSQWDDEDHPCQAGIYAQDSQDGTGQIVVTSTNYVHDDKCISRQPRQQQKQEAYAKDYAKVAVEPPRKERTPAHQDAARTAVCVDNTTTSTSIPPRPSSNVQRPVVGNASSPTIPGRRKVLQTEEAGPSACDPIQPDALVKMGTAYKTLEEANTAIRPRHALAYPYRSSKHGMIARKTGRLSADINCRLGHKKKVKDCGARIRLIRRRGTDEFHVAEVSLDNFSNSAAFPPGIISMLTSKLTPRSCSSPRRVISSIL